MNREEILIKSRNEKNDEGMLVAENQGRKLGMSVFCGVFMIFTLFNFINGLDNDAPMSMFWAFIAAEAFPKYKFTKNKTYLITSIAGCVAAVVYLLNYILQYMGK